MKSRFVKLFGIKLILGAAFVCSTLVAQDEEANREPASTQKREPAQDRQEGWVVRQTENGLVKVPAKQYFRFEGANLSGKAYTPFQAVFDQRPGRKNKSLIPVRTSFKREVLDASGYSGR
jgi:hypothetical protein